MNASASFRVSVVVCAIEPSSYLDQAVECLLHQTEADLQVVVVWDTATTFPAQPWYDSGRVKVVSTGRRSGTPNALNTGIAHCDAPLVGRLDHDDLSEPERFALQCDFLDRHPGVVAVGAWADLIDDEGVVIGPGLREVSGDVAKNLLHGNPVVHSSLVMRRDALASVSGYAPEATRMQDYELLLRLATVGTIHLMDQKLVSYRLHGAQFSRLSSPYKAYTRLVLRRRLELAQHLGASLSGQVARNAAWFAAQVLRFHGARHPGYVRGVVRGARG